MKTWLKKYFVFSFLYQKYLLFFSIFLPTAMLAYFCSILSVWVCACVCSIVCVCIFMFLDKFFSLLVLPEFSQNLPESPPKFARIQGVNCPPPLPTCLIRLCIPGVCKPWSVGQIYPADSFHVSDGSISSSTLTFIRSVYFIEYRMLLTEIFSSPYLYHVKVDKEWLT